MILVRLGLESIKTFFGPGERFRLSRASSFSNGGHIFQRIKNLHINSMQDTLRNIHTKFGSNWSSSVRGEEFWKIVNDDGRHVKAIAYTAFGQVS